MDRFPDGFPHALIGGQRFRVEFRVAAGQVQSVDVLRQAVVAQRREEDRFHAGFPERVQCLVIAELEGRIGRDRDADVRRGERSSAYEVGNTVRRFRRCIAQGEQRVEVDVRLRGICQQIQFSEQVRVLFRGHEAEVTALELRFLQMR